MPSATKRRGAVEEPGEPGVELLHGPEQELEVDQVHDYLLA